VSLHSSGRFTLVLAGLPTPTRRFHISLFVTRIFCALLPGASYRQHTRWPALEANRCRSLCILGFILQFLERQLSHTFAQTITFSLFVRTFPEVTDRVHHSSVQIGSNQVPMLRALNWSVPLAFKAVATSSLPLNPNVDRSDSSGPGCVQLQTSRQF
jgi:hypothetical protein